MEPADALLMLVVVGLAAAAVLRDIAAYERPPRERAPKPVRAPREKRRAVRGAAGQGAAPAAVPVAASVASPVTAPTAVAAADPVAPVAPVAARMAPVADPVAPVAPPVGDDTWLGQIARHTEHDERSAGRRVVSALLLLTLTLLAAGAVGALIYRGLAGLG